MVSLAIPSGQWSSVDGQFGSVWERRFDAKPVCPTTTELDVEYNQLVQSWKRFQDLLPPPDQVNFCPHPQDARDVVALVRAVQTSWRRGARPSAFARAMTLCDRFLATMDSHRVLLMILSEHECYSSLFYAVLQSLIKASANYPKIVEGLFKALVKVNESICLPVGKRSPPLADNMASQVARFYSLAFFLLSDFMDWYVRRSMCRLLTSPSQEVYVHFQNLVCTIRGRGLDIMREFTTGLDLEDRGCSKKRRIMNENASYLWEEARIEQVGRHGQDRLAAAQNTAIRKLIWELQDHDGQRARMREERELLLAQWFDTATYQLHPISEQNSGIACLTTKPAQDLNTSRFNWSYGSRRKYTRIELQSASAHLQDYFESEHQIAPYESDVQVVAEDNVMTSLRRWATNPYSQVLAVGGSPTTAFPTPVALISACYACFAHQAKLPVISHFCALPSRSRDDMTLFEQGLIALAYSLVRQLVDCLPPVVNSDVACHLGSERFRFLDGTLNCWKEVLSLIDRLIYHAPPLLLCVVDGLDILQDASTDPYIRSLVRVLLTHTRHETVPMPDGSRSQRVLFKVLFTVAGRPSSLVETLSGNQHILSESNRVDPAALADAAMISDAGGVVTNA